MSLGEVRMQVADFLNKEMISQGFLTLNFWHVVHFLSGGILMFLIIKTFKNKLSKRKKFLLLFAILVLYEVYEWFMVANGSKYYKGETGTDIFWDLFLGMLSGFLTFRLFSK